MRPSLLTDHYELTMVDASLESGADQRRCVFEVFARSLPEGRRYGVVCGTGRLLDSLADFSFGPDELAFLKSVGAVSDSCLDWLADYRFRGDVSGYPEGSLFFPGSPILTVEGSFAEAVLLETLILGVLNYDSAVAAAASRMVSAAVGRTLLEGGSRRTHERAGVAAARAAYICGFDATSNLAAGAQYEIPTGGTAAHAFVLAHDDERAAFAAQLATLGAASTFLVDTFDIAEGIRHAVEVVGPEIGGIRIDSGRLGEEARDARRLLDSLGARSCRITVSGDLDEYQLAELAAAPIDAYLIGTALVSGSGAPNAGLVYKLVEVDGRAVAKTSADKATSGGYKVAFRINGRELLQQRGTAPPDGAEPLQAELVRSGEVVADTAVAAARVNHDRAFDGLPPSIRSLESGSAFTEALLR